MSALVSFPTCTHGTTRLLPALIFAITCLMVVQDLFTGNLLQAGNKEAHKKQLKSGDLVMQAGQTSDEDLYDAGLHSVVAGAVGVA